MNAGVIATGCRWAGLLLIAWAALARSLVGAEPLPYWDVDPTRLVLAMTGLGPAGSMTLDAVALAGAVLGLVGVVLAGGRLSGWALALGLAGSAGVGGHALLWSAGTPDDAAQGSAWLAAVWSGIGVAHLARDERLLRAGAGLTLGLIVMLGARGVVQVFIEHPVTVAEFRRDPATFLNARGWTGDSAMARSFERRLVQPEATAWWGLANVLASAAACGLGAGAALAIGSLAHAGRRGERRWGVPLRAAFLGGFTLAVVSGGLLALTGSKGGFAAALLGMGVMALGVSPAGSAWLARRRWLGPGLALGAAAGALLAVVARGIAGERLGELSLLFRWFYLQGAARIFGTHPIVGVGPAGFKDAYLIAKPALSPEEVSSPHSVLFDLAATLGLFGLAWAGLVYAGLARAGGALRHSVDLSASRGEDLRGLMREAGAITLVGAGPAVVLGAWLESALATPAMGAARIAGLAGWGVVVAGCLCASRGALAVALGSAGVVLAFHAQIELTLSLAGSASWVAVLLGLTCGASPGFSDPVGVPRRRGTIGIAAPGLVVVLAHVGLLVLPAWRWEGLLRRAWQDVTPATELRLRLSALAGGSTYWPGDTARAVLNDLAERSGSSPGSQEQAEAMLRSAERDGLRRAMTALAAAAEVYPGHVGTARALGRACLASAAAARRDQDAEAARDAEERALAGARMLAERSPDRSDAWGWLGETCRAVVQLRGGTPDAGLWEEAASAWARAAELDPYGLAMALRLVEVSRARGDGAEERRWAARALELDRLRRLDPLTGLTESERTGLRAVSGGP